MPEASAIAILLIEDNPGDARLVREMLREVNHPGLFALTTVDRLALARDQLAEHAFDVVLLDLTLPDSRGLATLTEVRRLAPAVPIVVLTGLDDEDSALKAVQGGAQDYLVKGQGDGDLIRRAIRYAIERFRSDAALRRSEARLRAIFERAGIGILLVDGDGRCVEANPALMRMTGFQADELVGQQLADLTLADDNGAADPLAIAELLAGRRDLSQAEKRFRHKAGHAVWGRMTVTLVRGAGTDPPLLLCLIEDVTERRHMEERLRLAAVVLENTSEGVFVTDPEHRIIIVNPAFSHLTGYGADEVIGRKPSILSSGRHGADFYQHMFESLAETGKWQGEIWNRRKSGELFAEWLNIGAVRDEAGAVVHYVAVFSDITSRKQTEERLNYQVNHDPLTSLPNRTLFHERLSRALARAFRNGRVVGVLFLDLDHFKEINDTWGHLVGDRLLQVVAERLSGSIRQGDTAARLAGDEFMMILEDITDYRDAAIVAQKVLRSLAEPYDLADRPLTVTTSIGISLFPADGEDIQTLLHNADIAMYRAKKQGKNNYQFFSDELNAQAFERLVLEGSLRRALDRGEFRLHYQPIIDLESGQTLAVEALLRWQHPDVGLVAPPQFLATAEEIGLMGQIGRWVVATACRQLREWHDSGNHRLRMAINLSPSQLLQPETVELVRNALAANRLEPQILEIDVPESVVMSRGGSSDVLGQLRTLGVRVAIDDFGTGYSSFGHLRRLPVDTLKIDQTFVRDMMTDDDDARIITAITAIAHSLRLTVVAKGVETPEQLAFLKRHQCDLAQGHVFCRPLPADKLTPRLAENIVAAT